MAYEVKYLRRAADELTQLYVGDPRKDEITRAAHVIESELELRPESVGMANPSQNVPTRRSYAYYPLQYDYVVMGTVNEVWVLEVRLDLPRFP